MQLCRKTWSLFSMYFMVFSSLIFPLLCSKTCLMAASCIIFSLESNLMERMEKYSIFLLAFCSCSFPQWFPWLRGRQSLPPPLASCPGAQDNAKEWNEGRRDQTTPRSHLSQQLSLIHTLLFFGGCRLYLSTELQRRKNTFASLP